MCPVDVRGSLCLSWLSGVAGSEGLLGWVVPDSIWCATGHDTTSPLCTLETLAWARGCGGSDLLIVGWKGQWRPLDWNLESEAHLELILGQTVPCWGPLLNRRSSSGGLGWSVSISWEPGCLSSLSSPLRLHSEGQENTANCSRGSSLITRKDRKLLYS